MSEESRAALKLTEGLGGRVQRVGAHIPALHEGADAHAAAAAADVGVLAVSKVYGAVCAVRRASARFRAGCVSVIEGANGSGKSTLLGMLAMLVRPSSGTIDVGTLGRCREQVRAATGWLGTDSLSYPDLTGRENLALAARLHGLPPASAIVRASERFDLHSFLDRPVRVQSRGQRQRLALARALLHAPRLLLLDEPTTGLDPASTERLVDVLAQEAAKGAIVVLVTHDAEFARRVAPRAHFTMERGRLRTAPVGECAEAVP